MEVGGTHQQQKFMRCVSLTEVGVEVGVVVGVLVGVDVGVLRQDCSREISE